MLAMAAIIAVAAVPSFSRLLLESRMRAAVSTSLHAVNLARQLAATRGESFLLCGSADGLECGEDEDWSQGLLIRSDNGATRIAVDFGGKARGFRLRSNRADIRFEPGSGFATPASLALCDRRGSPAARAVIVSRAGRPRASERTASGAPIPC